MSQTKSRLPESVSLAPRLDPFGALAGYATAGYATVCTGVPDKSAVSPLRRDPPRPAFVPSCSFQRPAPAAPQETAPGEAGIAPEGDRAPWFARLWARYRAWSERQRAAAAWELVDDRTLRDIGVSRDVMENGERSASWWRLYDTVL